MQLDIPTLVFAATPVFAGLAAIQAAIWRLGRREPFLLALVASNAGFIVACGAVVLASSLPAAATILVSHGGSAFGFAMLWRAARLLAGRHAAWPAEILLVGTAIVSVAAALILSEGYVARAMLHSLFAAIGCGLAIRELRRVPAGAERRAIAALEACLGAVLALFVLRALVSPFAGAAASFLDPGVVQAATILAIIFASTVTALAAVSISFARVRAALEAESDKLRDANEALHRQALSAESLAAVARDERRKAEESERFVAQLMETVPVPLFYWTLDRRIGMANDRYAALYGQTRESIMGKTPEDLLPAHLAHLVRKQLNRLIADGGTQTIEAEMPVHGLGMRRHVAYRSLVRDEHDVPAGIAGALIDVTEQARLRAELEHLAACDPLTGLANRRRFVEQAEDGVLQAARSGRPLSLVMLDVDGFKRINDTFGHAVGDDILVRLGRAIRDALPDGSALAARMGGEEFVLLLPGAAGPDASALAETLRETVAGAACRVPGGPRRVTASFGVATLGLDGDDSVERLLKRADDALYRAKHGGRNRVASDATAAPLPRVSGL